MRRQVRVDPDNYSTAAPLKVVTVSFQKVGEKQDFISWKWTVKKLRAELGLLEIRASSA